MFQEYQYYVIVASVAAWLLPPFRQFREKYFIYFLILAFTDAVVTSLYLGIKIVIPNNLFYTVSSFLLYVTLFGKDELVKKKFLLLGLVLLIVVGTTISNPKQRYIVLCLFHTMIMYEFLKRFALDYSMREVINIFVLLLVSYEITIVTKFVVSILDIRWGELYFDLMSIFEIFLALTFAIFRERQLTFSVSKKEEPVV